MGDVKCDVTCISCAVMPGRADVHAEEAPAQHRRPAGPDLAHPLQLPGEATDETHLLPCLYDICLQLTSSSPDRIPPS